MLSLLAFVLGLLATSSATEAGCPPEEATASACICKNLGDGPMLWCSKLMSAVDLIPIIKATASYQMFSLAITDSSLLYIPKQVFKNTVYKKIRFLNSHIMSLSDGDLAFEGLENQLEEIRASGAHYIAHWNWSSLRKLHKLKLIDITLISMHSIDQEFPALKSLKLLGVSRSKISFIQPTAFRRLENLQILVLQDNEITEIRRSMLPNPATQLRTIKLSGNQLSSLPQDMFRNMPSLKELELSGNKLMTLDEDTFLWPFENLQLLHLRDNDFRCDCRMQWLVKVRKPAYFDGNCAAPDSLGGTSLKNLKNSVLLCEKI